MVLIKYLSPMSYCKVVIFMTCLLSENMQVYASSPNPQYHLSADQTHSKFSRNEKIVLAVESGAVIEVLTEETTDQQLNVNSTVEDLANIKLDPIHPLTGPVYVKDAQVGDILAVTLHEIEVGDWGFAAILPNFGQLAGEINGPYLRTFDLSKNKKEIKFTDKITIPLKPFPGVMGVAPDTDERLSTIPPRANGGNMDDPNITVGTTVYFPVFVKGALFSIGDTHATQGAGEVSGTAVEAPMRIVYELNVIKDGRKIQEPQYETDESYVVTAFATTLDEAAKKATRFMIAYLMEEHGLSQNDAYMLCSLAGELKIAEVVDVPHMLVTMHMSKKILGIE
jgi:acetamidase/formamidase